jgi:hypothetical protein
VPKPEAAEYAVAQVQQPKMMGRDTYRANNKTTAPQKSRNHAYKTRPYFCGRATSVMDTTILRVVNMNLLQFLAIDSLI